MSFLKSYLIIGFISFPLIAVYGFILLRHPHKLAKMNARVSPKNRKFDSPEQIARYRRLGVLYLIGAAVGFGGLLFMLYAKVFGGFQ